MSAFDFISTIMSSVPSSKSTTPYLTQTGKTVWEGFWHGACDPDTNRGIIELLATDDMTDDSIIVAITSMSGSHSGSRQFYNFDRIVEAERPSFQYNNREFVITITEIDNKSVRCFYTRVSPIDSGTITLNRTNNTRLYFNSPSRLTECTVL